MASINSSNAQRKKSSGTRRRPWYTKDSLRVGWTVPIWNLPHYIDGILLNDDFSSDTGLFTGSNGANPAISGGVLTATPTTGYYRKATPFQYDLWGKSAEFYNIANMFDGSVASAAFWCRVQPSAADGERLQWDIYVSAGVVTLRAARVSAAGSTSAIATLTYSATTHKDLRIRHDRSTNMFYWDYRGTTGDWVNAGSYSVFAAWGYNFSDVALNIGSGLSTGTASSNPSVDGVYIGPATVTSTTTPIGKDSQLVWNARAVTGDPSDLRWNTRAALGDLSDLRWNTRALITDSSILRWNTRTAIGDPSDLRWATRALAGDTSDLRWNLRALASDTSQLIWNTLFGSGPTLVQQAFNTSTVHNTQTATFSTGATAGNIIWCAVAFDKNAGTITGPSGTWNTILVNSSTSVSVYIAWKVAVGGETAITVTNSTTTTAGNTIWIGEYAQSGSGAWSVVSATNPTNESAVNSLSSGTTATLTQDMAALAFFAIDSGQSATSGPTFTNSFAEVNHWHNSGRGAIEVAYKATVASGATAETTASYTGTADQISAAIVAFARSNTSTVNKDSALAWAVRAALGDVSDIRWNTRALATDSSDIRWNTRTVIGDPSDIRWAVRTALGDVSDIRWATKALATDSSILRWNTRALASDVSDVRWNTRALATDSSDIRWAVRTALGDVSDLRWAVRALATDSSILRWNTRGLATDSSDIRWAVRTALGDVSDIRWATKALAGDSSDLRWVTRALAGDSSDLRWATRALATDSSVLRWATRTTLGDLSDIRWNVRALATDSSVLVWNVLSLAGTVGDNSILLWNVRANVTDSSDLRWAVRTTLGDLSVLRWNVRFALGDTSTVNWRTRALASDTSQLLWNTRALATDSSILRWAVRTSLGDTSTLTWRTRALALDTSQLVWKVRALATDSSQLVWNVYVGIPISNNDVWGLPF